MKKSKFMAVMLVIIVLSAAAFAGCGKSEAQEPETENHANQPQSSSTQLNQGESPSGQESSQTNENPQINGQDIQMGGSTMTFEEFMIGIKEDLSQEVMEELREIYEEWIRAEEENDTDKIIELYEIIEDMGVLTMEEQAPMYGFKKAP